MSASKRRRPRRVAERSSHYGRRLYLESSALVAAVLESDVNAMDVIRSASVVASVLTFAEARRALIRALSSGRIGIREQEVAEAEIRRVEDGTRKVDITGLILDRVGRRFPAEPIRTLDAIHLATAEMLDDPAHPVTLLTRDRRIAENAELLGLRVG